MPAAAQASNGVGEAPVIDDSVAEGQAMSSESALSTLTFRGETLATILSRYEARGFEFIYSRRVVRPNAVVQSEPEAGKPIDRLRTALAERRVTARPVEGERRFVLVRTPWRPPDEAVLPPAEEMTIAPGLEEVLVTSSRYALKRPEERGNASYQLRDNELNALPEVGDDALRAALHLPGMATVGLSAQPHVRGGLRDETLILFDGVELLEPFHLKDFQSLFSGLNPSLIKSIDVYTGGFPARYGRRLSGVVDIQPQTDFFEPGGELLVSLLTTSLSLHGPVAGGRGDWAASARRGNLDLVTEWINPSVGDPSYSDYYAQFNFALDASSEISATLMFFDDDIFLTDGEADDGENARSRYKNLYGWLKWGKRWSAELDSVTVLSAGRIRHTRFGFIVDDDPDDSDANASDERVFDLYTLRHRSLYTPGDTQLYEFGATLSLSSGRYDYSAQVRRGELAELVGITAERNINIGERFNGASGGLYASARFTPRAWLSVETGLRWDFDNYGNLNANYLSPRLGARIDFSERTRARLFAGRFHQSEALHELQVVDGFNTFQAAQRADHYILSLEHNVRDSLWHIRAEAFSKLINEPKQRFENLFNSLTLLPELGADRILVAAEKSRVRGFEISSGRVGKELSTYLSYSWSRAEDRFAGDWQPRSWDQRHTIAAGASWSPGQWQVSFAALWHSGWPTTYLPATIEEDGFLNVARNSARLPSYLSLDTRAARTWTRGRHDVELFLEVTNFLDRNNSGALEIELEELDEGGFSIQREPVRVLPWIPSIGVRWTF